MPPSPSSYHDTTPKPGTKRKYPFEGLLAPPTPGTPSFRRSPSPDLGHTGWTRHFRAPSPSMDGEDPNDDVINRASPEPESFLSNASHAFASIRSQFPRIGQNAELLASIAKTKFLDGGMINDKNYEIEELIQLTASLPAHSKARKILSRSIIKPLWHDLQHPPLSYLGNECRYRQANGSNNNIRYPQLGAAGSSYARTVTPKTLTPSVLPDAGLIFDTIFARGKRQREHPTQISSVFFYLASIITHDIFQTDEKDPNRTKNSSYLDLSPLYGSSDDPKSDAFVGKVRAFRDGKLKPDTFSEFRVYALPPGVAVLLICFNRFHNYIVSQLDEINEGGRFGLNPRKSTRDAEQQRDEDLYQTARLITCGLYVNVILHDYVRTILNLGTSDSSWFLDPRTDCETAVDSTGIPSGIGNQVSVEFNLVYRWHAAMSERDARWVEDLFTELFGDDDFHEKWGDPSQFFAKVSPYFAKIKTQDPQDRQIRGLARNSDGEYEDEDLVEILTGSTEDVAGALGAKNVPLVMKVIEVMGIEQARKWRVCTLNEFRNFFKLAPHATFDDITQDHELACTLKSLYSKPDYVELYPGLMAEDTKKSFEPGSGLCPGFTVSRTILADAVALVRGDRFYTIDYTPANLTNWGFNLIRSDPDIARGGVMYHLLMRAFPSYYEGNSVYAMFPFVHPERTRLDLTRLGKVADYDFSGPHRKPSPISVESFDAVSAILKNQVDFKVPWGPHTKEITGEDYMLSGDTPCHGDQRDEMDRDLYQAAQWAEQIRDYYHHTTHQLIEDHSHKVGKDWYQLDIVKNVGNLSHTLFVAQLFHYPVKDSGDLRVGVSAKDLYNGLAILFAYIFLDRDPTRSCKLRAGAKKASEKLGQLIRTVIGAVSVGKHLHINRGHLLPDYGKHMIERLLENGKTVDQIVADVLATSVAAMALQAQAMAQMLDIYLQEKHSHHWPEIRRCAYSDSSNDFDTLQKYALEACRLAPAGAAVLRTAARGGSIEDDERTVVYKRGDTIHLDFASAGRDKKHFSNNADEIDIGRSRDSYLHQGMGPHACLGRRMTEIALAVQLGLFARLKNLKRLPGDAGTLKYSTNFPGVLGTSRLYITEDRSSWWPFPTTMKVQHEGICQTLEEHESSHSRADSGVGMGVGLGLNLAMCNRNGSDEQQEA